MTIDDKEPGTDVELRTAAEIKRDPLLVEDGVLMLDTARFEQLQRVATMMAQAKLVPEHLRGSPADCFLVANQALNWQMDPFAVAQKTYAHKGSLGYEGQLIAAVVNTRAPIKDRLKYEWEGEGEDLVCIVSATLIDEDEPRVRRVKMPKVRNSPLWDDDPRQQLAYLASRRWARLYCSDVILGVYTQDELEDSIALRMNAEGVHVPVERPTKGNGVAAEVEPKMPAFLERAVGAPTSAPTATELHHKVEPEPEPEADTWTLIDSYGEESHYDTPEEFIGTMQTLIENALDADARDVLLDTNEVELERYKALLDAQQEPPAEATTEQPPQIYTVKGPRDGTLMDFKEPAGYLNGLRYHLDTNKDPQNVWRHNRTLAVWIAKTFPDAHKDTVDALVAQWDGTLESDGNSA